MTLVKIGGVTYGYIDNIGAKKSYEMYNSDNNSIKLFVFGDSYVDTGNSLNWVSYAPPYGITFPSHPTGKFGNGRILTDYLGVYETGVDGPNLTVQINTFE
ncbi:unnamed protein product [Lupinus luteus]|uniref:Uncharacterized protein n=1 Tax=Lupinus luteus TaxID=3873 RepID=A0AAV1VRX5_LUPLU